MIKQFPVVKASGSHYEVGRAVGTARRNILTSLYEKNTSTYPEYFTRHRKESREIFDYAKRYFPQYIDELRGIADGSGIDIYELFLSNSHEVFYFADPYQIDHCTIVAIPTKSGYIVGHNEDWEPEALEHLFILDAEIEGVKIFGLVYDFTNTIIGDSVAINQFGLIQAINEVSHDDRQNGVPKGFIARAILDCKTLEDAEELMKKIPRRSGFNHLLVQGERLWNIESSAKEYQVVKVKGQKYVHTNHYLTELKRIDKGNKESEARYEKVRKLLPGINSVEDIKRVLSDPDDPQICRPGTIGSVILDPQNKKAHISYGQPSLKSYYTLTVS